MPYSAAFFYGVKRATGPTLHTVKKWPLPVTAAVGITSPVILSVAYFAGLTSILGLNMSKLRQASETSERQIEHDSDLPGLSNDMQSFIGMTGDVIDSADMTRVTTEITKSLEK